MIKILYIILFLSLIQNCFSQEQSCFVELEPIEFKVYMDSCSNEILLDVRPMEYFKNKALPKSLHVPAIEELERIIDTLDHETPIFVYCVIGMRSTKVCKLLCEKKFITVYNLQGGIEGWKKADLETVKIKKK